MPPPDHGAVALNRLDVAVAHVAEIPAGARPQAQILLGVPVDLVVPGAVPRARVVGHLVVLESRLRRELGEAPVLRGGGLLGRHAGHSGRVPETALVEGEGIRREMVGPPVERLLDRGLPGGQIEAGQTVDQVDADVVEAGGAGRLEGLSRLGRRVKTVEGGQDAVVEALDTEADPRHPRAPIAFEPLTAHALRIAFDGDLGPRHYAESLAAAARGCTPWPRPAAATACLRPGTRCARRPRPPTAPQQRYPSRQAEPEETAQQLPAHRAPY